MSDAILVISLSLHPHPLTVPRERKIKQDTTCEDCYKIKCRGCGWEPNDEELVLVQKQIITVCPKCGWKPSASK